MDRETFAEQFVLARARAIPGDMSVSEAVTLALVAYDRITIAGEGETPRTDAFAATLKLGAAYLMIEECLDFARTLERELAALRGGGE